jgi:hypothetical protein
MSAIFTYRPSEGGWFIETESPTTSMEVSAIIGREVRSDDFPGDLTVVGHVQVGGKWIVILKRAAERELRGLLLERDEYPDFDPFRAAASITPVWPELTDAISAAASLPPPIRAILATQPGTDQEMFSNAGLQSYLPYAYAAFVQAPTTERRQRYWSYLPAKFNIATYPLARFGALGKASIGATQSLGPGTPTAASPEHPWARPAGPSLASDAAAPAAIMAKLEELEQRIVRLSPDNRPLPSVVSQYDRQFSGVGDALRIVESRLDKLEMQQRAARKKLETIGPAAPAKTPASGKTGEPAPRGAEDKKGKTSVAQPVIGPTMGTASGGVAGRSTALRWMTAPVVAIVASASTAGLLTFLTRPDLATDVKQAQGWAKRAEDAAANVRLAGDNAVKAVEVKSATAVTDITEAATVAKAAVTDAGNAGSVKIEQARSAALESLTKVRDATLACMPGLAKAQIELASAEKQNQRASNLDRLGEALRDAEAKCAPKP